MPWPSAEDHQRGSVSCCLYCLQLEVFLFSTTRKTKQFWNVHLLCITSRWHMDKPYWKNYCICSFCPLQLICIRLGGKAYKTKILSSPTILHHYFIGKKSSWKGSEGRNILQIPPHFLIMDAWEAQRSLPNPQFAEVSKPEETSHHW